ncbi:hypothetical protein F5Y14DRAFT_461543 [Nemania sp. NC0429]|nr:hypothetical protein F5Y14DRAFT_461543 [Nemania sp. NC0429]
MSRLIDRLPAPKQVREKKVIVLSRSRVGTLSLYHALTMLGYKAYHMIEVVWGGPLQMALFEEALRCKYLGEGKPYGKEEFDKWLAEYDVEIPQFFPEEFVEFYPNACFILTERSLDSWTRSMNNTITPVMTAIKSFPLSVLRNFDSVIDAFCSLIGVFETVMYHGKTCKSQEGVKEAEQDTLQVSKKVKMLVPEDRLLVAKLEDGFGWEQICPFLGHPIPENSYPKGNTPPEFQKVMDGFLGYRVRKAGFIALSAVAVPILGLSVWYYVMVGRPW